MPEGLLLPHQQHISNVSAQGYSQAFAGSARDVYFGASKPEHPQKSLEQACRNALFLTNPAVDRETLITTKGARVPGTCEWITRHEEYQQWLCGNTRLLWISGGPGKGKTMMSIFLTEELEKHVHDANLVFFFCAAQDESRNTSMTILRGLIYQIITKRPRLVRHALPDFETPERTQQTLSSFETLWLIFKKLAIDEELGTMFCVLDGLDECHENTVRWLVPRLVDLLCCEGSAKDSAQRTTALKLVIISREMPGLQNCVRLRLDPDNNEKVTSDIERVVSTRVNELSHIAGFDDEFRKKVQTSLLERAEGTFLWVGFAVHELSQKQTCSQVLGVLESLPKGLPEIYRRMLLRIPAEERQICSSILHWVTLALRPLNPLELACAVGVKSPHELISLEDAIREKIALCGPLLKVKMWKVDLVHQSVRDYLLRKEEDHDVVLEAYRIAPQNAHLKILQSCLDCIIRSDFQHGVAYLYHESIAQEPLLLEYAATHWPKHARGCATWDPELLRLLRQFLEIERTVRRNWWVAYREKDYRLSKVLPLLHMVSYLGFEPLVQATLAWDNWRPGFVKIVNRRDSEGNTALHAGVLGGRTVIVQLLVDNGADINAKNNLEQTALQMAIRKRNDDIVRLLVDKRADLRMTDNRGQTVLHYAVYDNNEFAVRLLVANGADARPTDKLGRTVLHCIASENSEAVVQSLVDRGVDVKATDDYGRTMLHCAVEKNHEFAVRLLVEKGADVRATDNLGRTVLHRVSLRSKKSRDMVRFLMERGMDIEHRDLHGYTVLGLAVKEMDDETVHALLELGADVNAKANDGRTPLLSSHHREGTSVTAMLYDYGARYPATLDELDIP